MKIVSLQLKLRLIIILFIVILLVILGGVVYPGVRDILTLQQEIDNTEEFLESQYQRSRRIAQRVGNVEEVVSSTSAFTALTVTQGSELEIIQTFESLAETFNIEQKLSVQYSEKADPKTKLPYYTFSFLNHGYMEDHIEYLDAVLAQPYIVQIDTLDMSRRNTNAGNSNNTAVKSEVTLRFSATIYAK